MRFFDIYVMVFIFNLFDLTLVKLIIEIEKNISQLRCYNNILCEKSHKSLYGLFCKRNSHLNPKPLEQGQEETHQGVNHIYKGKKTNRFNIKLQFNTQHTQHYFLIITEIFFSSLQANFTVKICIQNFFHSHSKFPNDLTFNNHNNQIRIRGI